MPTGSKLRAQNLIFIPFISIPSNFRQFISQWEQNFKAKHQENTIESLEQLEILSGFRLNFSFKTRKICVKSRKTVLCVS
jgi:hypothetical protein